MELVNENGFHTVVDTFRILLNEAMKIERHQILQASSCEHGPIRAMPTTTGLRSKEPGYPEPVCCSDFQRPTQSTMLGTITFLFDNQIPWISNQDQLAAKNYSALDKITEKYLEMIVDNRDTCFTVKWDL